MNANSPTPAPVRKRRRLSRRLLKAAGVVALILIVLVVGVRLALPGYLRDYVNRVIDQSPDYDGRITSIDVHLWRGAYTIHDIKLVKTTLSVPVPFFECPRMDLSLDWRSLFRGQARGKILMDKPRVNFVHGPSEEETQTGAAQPWLGMLNDLYPFRIELAEIRDGEVRFRAFHTTPEVNISLTEANARLANLTNVEDKLDPLMATLHATGLAMDSGRFEMDMQLDPHSHRPNFSMAVRLLGLDVVALNSVARAYAGLDFEAGELDFVLEASAHDGFLEGNAKPLFRNLQILGAQDFKERPFQAIWESAVDVVSRIFRNQLRNQLGTSITLSGDLDNPSTNILEILGNLLYNAFVQAFLPLFEGRYAPEVVEEKESP